MENNIVYHYTTGEALSSILLTKTLWVTNSNFCNDPSEIKYVFDVLNELNQEFGEHKNYDIFTNLLSQGVKIYDVLLDKAPTYILSFCKDKDLLPMWKYYACSTGYNIGFDVKLLYQNLKKIKGINPTKAVDVHYSKIEQELLKNVLEPSVSIVKDDNTPQKNKNFFQTFLTFLFPTAWFIKHPAYADEKESRMMILADLKEEENYEKLVNNRITLKGSWIEYLKIPFDPKCIKSIMCSPQTSDLQLYALKKFLKHNGYGNVVVDRSKIPYREL